MEDKIFYMISCCAGLVLLQHVFLLIILLKLNSNSKKVLKTIENQTKSQEETNTEIARVMTSIMKYLEKEFEANYQNQKKQQEWSEKNLEVISTNVVKSLTGIEQTQRFLGRMSESLGIVQRNNLQDV
jgi:hypothetical protein